MKEEKGEKERGDNKSNNKFFRTDTEWNTTLYLDVALDGVSQDGHNLTFVEGDNLTFTCYGNKMLTSQDLRWKLDGERLTGGRREGNI